MVGARRAQTSSVIAGVMRDASGAVIRGATIEATSRAMLAPRTVVADGTGQYRIVDLRRDEYAVTFTLQGFQTVKRNGMVLPA